MTPSRGSASGTSQVSPVSAGLRARIGTRLVAGVPLTEHPDRLRARIEKLVTEECPLLPVGDRAEVVDAVMADARGLGALEPLMRDPAVTEIMVNGPGPVWVERRGGLERLDLVLDGPAIHHLIEKIVAPLGLRVDRSSPVVDARLPDGSRVNAVVPPLAVDGPCLTVRRFGATAIPLDDFAPEPVARLLRWGVAARLNLLVCGGTGSGKTTLLNALAACIPDGERVITVEDAAELRLPGSHVVRLESRPANAEGTGAVSIRELVRNALRMRPDRIVVGEVRGPEALDMLQAMNTGHEGSMSTCHANGADDALRRIETMVLMDEVRLPLAAVRSQMSSSLDLVVVLARRPGGARRVVAVAEVASGPDTDVASGVSTRLLADEQGIVALRSRPARSPGGQPLDTTAAGANR